MKYLPWVVAWAALMLGSFTASPTIAMCCGIVFGVVLENRRTRVERRQLFDQTAAALRHALDGCALLVDTEQKRRGELEREAAHYRRLYLQKVERG